MLALCSGERSPEIVGPLSSSSELTIATFSALIIIGSSAGDACAVSLPVHAVAPSTTPATAAIVNPLIVAALMERFPPKSVSRRHSAAALSAVVVAAEAAAVVVAAAPAPPPAVAASRRAGG